MDRRDLRWGRRIQIEEKKKQQKMMMMMRKREMSCMVGMGMTRVLDIVYRATLLGISKTLVGSW